MNTESSKQYSSISKYLCHTSRVKSWHSWQECRCALSHQTSTWFTHHC